MLIKGDIVYNAIKAKDGTILESKHRHDFQEYTDDGGGYYMVDGGLSYLRRGLQGEELSLYYGDPHESIREVFTWGTYGPKGDQPLTYVLLKDMSEAHIKAIISDKYRMSPLMQDELDWRTTNEQRITNDR